MLCYSKIIISDSQRSQGTVFKERFGGALKVLKLHCILYVLEIYPYLEKFFENKPVMTMSLAAAN